MRGIKKIFFCIFVILASCYIDFRNKEIHFDPLTPPPPEGEERFHSIATIYAIAL
jgi:hypothetical protein